MGMENLELLFAHMAVVRYLFLSLEMAETTLEMAETFNVLLYPLRQPVML